MLLETITRVSYLLVNPVWNTDVVTSGLIFHTSFAVEEPQQHLQIRRICGAVHRNEIVALADLIDIARHGLRREGEFLAIVALDVRPYVFGHGTSAASLGSIMIAECCAERQVASDEWSHDLIDQRIYVLRSHPLTGEEIAVEEDEVGLLVVED